MVIVFSCVSITITNHHHCFFYVCIIVDHDHCYFLCSYKWLLIINVNFFLVFFTMVIAFSCVHIATNHHRCFFFMLLQLLIIIVVFFYVLATIDGQCRFSCIPTTTNHDHLLSIVLLLLLIIIVTFFCVPPLVHHCYHLFLCSYNY